MYKKIIKLAILAPLLMAFQCEDDLNEPKYEYNTYKVAITPQATFSLDDTIWIDAIVSSQIYDVSVNDSIFNSNPQGDIFSVYKFIQPTQHSNAKDAFDKFELIYESGECSFLPSCENGQATVIPVLSDDGTSYIYRIGLEPLVAGDYVISWYDSKILNVEKNKNIAEEYPITIHPNEIGFNRCGSVSWLSIDDSVREYFFRVE